MNKRILSALALTAVFISALVTPALAADSPAPTASITAALTHGGKGFVLSEHKHGADWVIPKSTVYYPIAQDLTDSKNFKIRVRKGEGAEYIESVSITEKQFEEAFAPIDGGAALPADTVRHTCVAVKLKENMTGEENQVSFEMKVTARQDGVQFGGVTYQKGDVVVDDVSSSIWVKNKVLSEEEANWDVNTGGFVVKPTRDEENEIVWENDYRDVARLDFVADSEATVYYPKLSTAWGNRDYEREFANSRAYQFHFVGNPTIPAAGRVTLSIYNPYVNTDETFSIVDAYTIDAFDLLVYEVIDGEAVDITDRVKVVIDDNWEQRLTLRTRTLGTYIVAPHPYEIPAQTPQERTERQTASAQVQKTNPKTGV